MFTVTLKDNETFARGAEILMPGFALPPSGAFTLELRRRPGADVALSFSSAAGSARVLSFDAQKGSVVLALLASAQDVAALSGVYRGDLVYVQGADVENIASFIFDVQRGVSRPSLPAAPSYNDISAWGPITDISGANDATVLQLLQRGLPGAPGPANTLSIGAVTTGAVAAASITGAAPNQTLNLTIPSSGSGGAGQPGPPNTLTIGTVVTGAAGSSAAASITGTAPNQTLNLTIPQGATGAAGAPGAAGAAGAPGPANALMVGTVSTGAAGSSAAASITGAAPNQTLNLTIPQGTTGAAGAPGAAGAVGAAGPTGAAGAPGSQILATTGAPAAGTGNNGDWAIDSGAKAIYGPKVSGAWPSAVSLGGGGALAVKRIDVLTTTQTYTQQAGDVIYRVIAIGGGGGGGSGARTASGASGGGGGGAPAAYVERELIVSQLAASFTVTIGAGGSGGAAAANSSSGSPGTPGGASSFGSYLTAHGGSGGGGGTSSAGGAGRVVVIVLG